MYVLDTPYATFNGRDGKPMQNGYVYIGTVNANPELSPLTAYWDAALTQPAPQPLRTLAGVVHRDGTPAAVYTSTDYSLLVQDENGVQVSYIRSAADLSSTDAGKVTYTPGGRTVEAELNDLPVSVKKYGAKGDGLTTDRDAIWDAMSANKRVYFPAGTYFLGNWATSDRIFDMTALGDNIDLITDGNVEFLVNCTANVNPVVFYLRSNNHFHAGRMKFRDSNYDRVLQRGMIPYTLDAYSANWGNVAIDGIYAKNCHTAFQCATPTTTRVRNIHIKQLHAYQCNRGACFQDQGDGVTIDLLYTEECERAWFGYGVTGHKLNIFSRNNFGTTGVVNVCRWTGGYDTSAIDINYTSRDDTLDLCHVLINHIDVTDVGKSITGIKVHVDIRGSANYDPVRIVNYTAIGGSETAGASSNLVGDITLSGSCDAQARDVEVVASYGSTRRLNFTSGRFFEMDDSVKEKFALGGGSLYSPIAADWGAPTPPELGNASFARSHIIDGGMCHMQYTMTMGSSTTYGTGEWVFTAPIAAAQSAIGTAHLYDNGTMNYIGAAKITTGNSTIKIYCDGASTAIGAAVPFTWAAGDTMFLTLSYQIA